MRASHGGTRRARSGALLGTLLTCALVSGLVMIGLPGTGALFTADYPRSVAISASRIFRAERVTPAFAVSDASSGSAADRSSSTAFANDGRYFLTRAWPVAFSASRYIEADMSNPLPAGLAVSGAAFHVRIASDAGTGSACVYAELRRASTGALLSSHGSSASPLGCTSGSTYLALTIPVGAITTTDLANDARLRIYARDSVTGALRLDRVTLVGDTPYTTFALYPVLTRELVNGQTETVPWALKQ